MAVWGGPSFVELLEGFGLFALGASFHVNLLKRISAPVYRSRGALICLALRVVLPNFSINSNIVLKKE